MSFSILQRLGWMLGGLSLLLQACAAVPQLEARHRVSGLNSVFGSEPQTFAEYIEYSRAMIANAHTEADPERLRRIVEGNAPFELKPSSACASGMDKPYRRGVLLVHGVSDSPYFMRHLAAIFQENCFRVMAVLLPGHGTRPGDLLDVIWQEWARTVAYGTERMAAEADEVYLAGYSVGAALSFYQSQRDARVRGLFLFSPAFEVPPKADYANLHKLYSWLIPSAKWVRIKPDNDLYKYESFAKNAAAQVSALIRETAWRQHRTSIPVFAAASADDATVNPAATLEFIARAQHPASRLVWYGDGKSIPPGVSASKLELVNSIFPERKILGSAHTSLVLPPEDAYYGEQGEYRNCHHYYPDQPEKYAACTSAKDVLYGELTEQNLRAGTLCRLTYNPNFDRLKISLQRFIGALL